MGMACIYVWSVSIFLLLLFLPPFSLLARELACGCGWWSPLFLLSLSGQITHRPRPAVASSPLLIFHSTVLFVYSDPLFCGVGDQQTTRLEVPCGWCMLVGTKATVGISWTVRPCQGHTVSWSTWNGPLGSWLARPRVIKQIEGSFTADVLIIVQPLWGRQLCLRPLSGPALTRQHLYLRGALVMNRGF